MYITRLALLAASLVLAACDQPDPPADAPQNLTATGGENLVVIDWDTVANRTYWAYYKTGSNVSQQDYDLIIYNITAPHFITGLDNGTQYAVTLTSSVSTSPVGPFSAIATATPRLLDSSIPWTISSPLGSENFNDVVFDEDYFVAVGNAGTVFMGESEFLATDATYGTAGVAQWTAPTLPAIPGVDLAAVISDSDNFVALGRDGSVIRSSDGDLLTWETATGITAGGNMNDLTISSTRFVAVGDGGAIYTNTSGNLSSAWTQQTSNTGEDLHNIRIVGSVYIATGSNGAVVTSFDGVNWTVRTAVTANTLNGVAFSSDEAVYVAVGDAGTILTSSDLTSWTLLTGSTPTANLADVIYGADGQFIAIGDDGSLAYSDTGGDGTWVVDNDIDNLGTAVPALNAITANVAFMAVGNAGTVITGK